MRQFRFGAVGVALSFVAIVSSQEASHDPSRLQPGLYPLEMRPITPVRPGTNMGDQSRPINSDTWTFLGPAPIVNGGADGQTAIGRIVGIAAHPTDANTIYVAAPGGGVWKTTNGGSTWFSVTEGEVTQAMGAIAIAPSNPNVIYAGTGEGNTGGYPNFGRGILVSSDAGTTWTLSSGNGALDGEAVFQIAVHPTNPDIAYVAVEAGLGWTFHRTGIYKTTDRGVTWNDMTTSITASCNPVNGYWLGFPSVQIDPSQPSTVYAAAGPAFGCSSALNGIYKSLDGGASWILLVNAPHGTQTGRTTLAVSKSNPQVVYVSMVKFTGIAGHPQNGSLEKFLRSDDGGATYSDLTAGTPNYFGIPDRSQGAFDTTLIVDPSNAAIVFAGGGANCQDLLRSIDSGVTWTAISNCVVPNGSIHVDHHASAFDANGKYLDGNDGGIFRLNSVSPVQWADLNGNLNTIQFYGIALHPTDPHIAFGGSQDNGTEKYTGTLGWTYVDSADGGLVRFSTTNVNRIYHTIPGLDLFRRSDDGGTTWESKVTGITDTRVNLAPFVVDPANGDHVLYGALHVWETVNGGDSWTAVGAAFQSNAHAIALAPSDPNVIYAAAIQNFGGDQFWVTTNHGTNWTAKALPLNAFVGDMQVSPSDPMTMYFVDSGFDTSSDQSRGRVFKSTNGGTSWANISGNLSELPVYSIQVDWSIPGRLFLGTSDGVYISNNDGRTWNRLGTGLPRAVVYQIELSRTLGILGAATHGRGLWEIALRSGFTDDPLLPSMTVKAVHILEPRSRLDALRSSKGLSPWTWTDPSLTPGVTSIRGQHVLDVRDALAATFTTIGRPAPLFADASLTGVTPKAAHITEIRTALASLESANTPGIVLFSPQSTVGGGLVTGPFTLRLEWNPGGATIHMTSSNPSLALLSPTDTTAGAGAIDVSVPAGTTDATYFIQGADPAIAGTATVTASAAGFTNGTGTVNVVHPTITSSVPTSMSVAGGLKQLFVTVGLLRDYPVGIVAMPVRPGAPVTVTVSSSDGAVLHFARQDCDAAICTMPILPNWSTFSNTFFLWPTAPGSTTVTVTAPGFIGWVGTTVQVTVTP